MNDLEHRLRRHLQDEATRLTPPPSAGLPTRARGGRRPRLLLVAAAAAAVVAGIVMVSASPDQQVEAVDPTTTTVVERMSDDGEAVRITVASGGWSWQPLALPAGADHVVLDGERVIAVDRRPTVRLWVSHGDGWAERRLPAGTTSVADPDGGWLVASDEQGALHASSDTGVRWTAIDLEAPSNPQLMRSDTIVGPAVRHGDELIVAVTRWRDLDAAAYLALAGSPLGDNETDALVHVFEEVIDVFGPDGAITRRVEIDKSLLGPEALAFMLSGGDGQTTELVRLDPTSGAVSETLAPPGPTFGVASMESRNGALIITDWLATRSTLVDNQWVTIDDEPSLGTFGGVEIDVRDGRLRLGPTGDLRPLSALGLAYVHASADDGGVLAVTEPSVEPPLVVVDVPEGQIEFGLQCCVTFTNTDGIERTQLYQGPFSGQVEETADGWRIETEGIGTMTISEDTWSVVLERTQQGLAGDGHGRVLATTNGTDWTLSPTHELLGAPLPYLTPQLDADRALLSGFGLPETPEEFLRGEPGPLLAWVAEVPS